MFNSGFSRVFLAIGLLLSSLIISGCVAPNILTNNTVFYNKDYAPRGSIVVLPVDAEKTNSLEFKNYREKFEAKLGAHGYTIVRDPKRADYVALVTYGIDNGETTTVTAPVYGYYGIGFYDDPFWHNHHHRGPYIMPSYGVVSSSTTTVTHYNRAIAMDIVTADSLRNKQPEKIYEARTQSRGGCPVIVEVFDEMLTAMFTDFPGENGRNRILRVEGDFNC